MSPGVDEGEQEEPQPDAAANEAVLGQTEEPVIVGMLHLDGGRFASPVAGREELDRVPIGGKLSLELSRSNSSHRMIHDHSRDAGPGPDFYHRPMAKLLGF